jgi:uncharacterized membrane protein
MSIEIPDRPVFSAMITENRSLTPSSFRLVITLVCLASIVSSLPFMVLGAWPVAGFFGIDLIALYVAFKVNFARARGFEEVIVTPIEILLRKVSWRGEEACWRFNPAWTRLESTRDDDFGMMRLVLVSRGVTVPVAVALSPHERESFAESFTRALSLARRGVDYEQG